MENYICPEIPHLPFSPGAKEGDKVLKDDIQFYKCTDVVVTCKMDGENVTIWPDGSFYGETEDSMVPKYYSWLRKYLKEWTYMLPKHIKIVGQYLYAKHYIDYPPLPTYFEALAAVEREICIDWKRTYARFQRLGLLTTPVLYVGPYGTNKIKHLAKLAVEDGHAGIIVRNADQFTLKDFSDNIAQYVREDFEEIKLDEISPIIPNKLI